MCICVAPAEALLEAFVCCVLLHSGLRVFRVARTVSVSYYFRLSGSHSGVACIQVFVTSRAQGRSLRASQTLRRLSTENCVLL